MNDEKSGLTLLTFFYINLKKVIIIINDEALLLSAATMFLGHIPQLLLAMAWVKYVGLTHNHKSIVHNYGQ